MKSLKKLLLCIIISVLITNFIAIGITITCVLFDNTMVQIELCNRFSKDKVEKDQIIEYYRQQERIMNEIKEENLDLYGEDYPIYGMFSAALPLIGIDPIISMYIMSIVIGLVIGIVVYLIFIEDKKGLEAIISFVICFIITVLLYYLLQVLSDILNNSTTGVIPYFEFKPFEWHQLIIGYAVTFIGMYFINLIHQKRVTNKLNKELNK